MGKFAAGFVAGIASLVVGFAVFVVLDDDMKHPYYPD